MGQIVGGTGGGDSLQIKNLTLGLGLVLSSTALAQQTYKLRNGDCDWTIARKFNTTIHKLHQANPQIDDWNRVHNGTVLHIPSSGSSTVAHVSSSKAPHMSGHLTTRAFKVSSDDTDWIIAHHLGVSIKLIHQLNPGVDWNRLRPGKHILVPVDGSSSGEERVARSSSKGSSKTKINRIRGRYAVVNTDGVTIRREPGLHADRITTVDSGTKVVVLDRDGAWYQLRFPRGTEGWVRGDFLNARKAPSRRHQDDDGEGRVVRRSSHRRHGSGHEATVFLDSDTKANPIIKKAVAMRGTRYSLGSNSRSATDCSGLTWQVYKSQGVNLPRTSGEQSHVGTPVSSGHLKPGDLVFFSSRGHRHSVGHVGIYVGNDKFIHASSGAGKVTFSSLHDPYYQNHYKGARRVVKTSTKKSSGSSEHKSHAEHASTSNADTNPQSLDK